MFLCDLQEGLRVIAHKKIFREWTGLQRVQTLRGHDGVIWAVAFNSTASHMATAGKDRIVRLWANRQAPQDRCALCPYCVWSFCPPAHNKADPPRMLTAMAASLSVDVHAKLADTASRLALS